MRGSIGFCPKTSDKKRKEEKDLYIAFINLETCMKMNYKESWKSVRVRDKKCVRVEREVSK